jgi:dephospho-CoA kinase
MTSNPTFPDVGPRLEAICSHSGILLLGITGGVASGKSTIAEMLQNKGAILIDFDRLARDVVQPGMPAFHEIVDYFGNDVLQDNGSLDRKRLSDIVFHDTGKRRILEGFIYSRIADLFIGRIREIAQESPDAIIQVVVPLLIEAHMQHLFHKIVAVHIPREEQIKRLMTRDGITSNAAEAILNAQMPIDEKIRHADFVIDNHGSLDATKKQVDALWKTLYLSKKLR